MSKALCIVTGASRGFGAALVPLLAESKLMQQHENLTFVLTARTTAAMEPAVTSTKKIAKNAEIHKVAVDFASYDLDANVASVYDPILKEAASFSHVYLFNNAGTLGPAQRMRDIPASEIMQSLQINVASPFLLSARCASLFGETAKKIVITNISSIVAIKAMDCNGLYGAGKAARNLFHEVLALEEAALVDPKATEATKNTKLRTLNYAPGPLDTDMNKALRDGLPDIPFKRALQSMHQNGRLVALDASIKKMIGIIETDDYTNGQHIDYFDAYMKK